MHERKNVSEGKARRVFLGKCQLTAVGDIYLKRSQVCRSHELGTPVLAFEEKHTAALAKWIVPHIFVTCNSSGGQAAVLCRQRSALLFSCPGSVFICSLNGAASLGIFHWKMDVCRSYLSLHVHLCWFLPCKLPGGQLKGLLGAKVGEMWLPAAHSLPWASICAPGVLSELQGTRGGGRWCSTDTARALVCVKRDFVARSASNSQCTYTVPFSFVNI